MKSHKLPPGSRVALVAPAGPLLNESELVRSVENARSFGWEPVVADSALARYGYFAGDDDARLADLQSAILDSRIDGIWCLRGGYGAMRLLERVDLAALARADKPVIGYSDITALHALWQRAGVASFHGPTARSSLTTFSRQSFESVVVRGEACRYHAPHGVSIRDGRVTGRLTGGNVALLAAMCGTPFQMDFRHAIVILEDIGEAVYRIDRMMVQLRLARAFDECAGLVFGQFTDCPDTTDDGSRALLDIIQETAHAVGVPTLSNVPIGHIDDQWTIPFGQEATLDPSEQTLTVHPMNRGHS